MRVDRWVAMAALAGCAVACSARDASRSEARASWAAAAALATPPSPVHGAPTHTVDLGIVQIADNVAMPQQIIDISNMLGD